MSPELWRPVPDYPHYEVSSLGRVRRGGRIIKPWKLNNGRWQVKLHHNNAKKGFNTYRLVALAFLGPPPFPGAVVAHKDDNKDNNSVSNLKWCTQRENYDDAIRNGRTTTGRRNGAYTKPHRRPRGERQGMAKLTWAAVHEIRTSTEGPTALARRFGVSTTAIKLARAGKTWVAA